ncbi:MAG TPA: NADH:flavin oxidoreductase [Desulfobacterales bacterium]|nr:NADH:flavin oxidoreductase [Desulfobacterales bacterium]
MSTLFTPIKIGKMEVKNRFVHSATYEAMALETGEVTDDMIKRYSNLAKGEIGLITPGFMYVQPLGKAFKYQTAIYSDEMITGLRKLVEAVHQEGGKIAFQLVHAGLQTFDAITGQSPLAPSKKIRNPMSLKKPEEMKEEEIQEAIKAFAKAANRAGEAGADAVQFHGAHGFLISEFLSPFFNRRKDSWGGSDENRFRFLKEVFQESRKALPDEMPILIKMNTNDFTPKTGVTPELAKKYAGWLVELGINGVELSCGTHFTFHTTRGEIPADEFLKGAVKLGLPKWMKFLAKLSFKKLAPKCSFEEGYNLAAAKVIKPVLGEIPLMIVGGMRRIKHMEEVLENKFADLISISRPLIREPFLIKKFREGKTEEASCVSCNKCLAAIFNNLPVRCYNDGLPV